MAVARGKAKAEALKELGADVVIDSSLQKDEPLRKLIKVGISTLFFWRRVPDRYSFVVVCSSHDSNRWWIIKSYLLLHRHLCQSSRVAMSEWACTGKHGRCLSRWDLHFWHAILLQNAAPRGIDVVFDPVGGIPLNEALKCVKWNAHILFIGFASGHIPKVGLLPKASAFSYYLNHNFSLQSLASLARRVLTYSCNRPVYALTQPTGTSQQQVVCKPFSQGMICCRWPPT